MPYRYRVSLEETDNGDTEKRRLVFDTVNHDDIFSVIDRIAAKSVLPADETAEFAVGLKLFGEIMLRHRGDPLFQELLGQVGAFIRKLKALEDRSPADAEA
ncbi:DUF3861 domain-containing protein [Sphingomonas sp. MG17]|uniref:DUF3861 domain-containing protein n=1 Tax=Sphingomonas tagetis TaxID=2949092 RepID=A0A9X2HS50_9SPHN|nr:DUF3861 domain-containing protein [Sphingomonas tagetis]MCP3732589.1 DUF3861 domain-containing protein [Sphingomonas tagetis]